MNMCVEIRVAADFISLKVRAGQSPSTTLQAMDKANGLLSISQTGIQRIETQPLGAVDVRVEHPVFGNANCPFCKR